MNKLEKLISLGVEQPQSEQLLGVKFIHAEKGQSTCLWTIEKQLMNANGVTLGGFITAAADIGMAYALLSDVDFETNFTSISINTSYHRPALIGEVEIKSNIKRQGRTTAYLESELYQNNRLIADATSTVLLLHNEK